VEPALTWGFTFDFAEIDRDYGEVTPELTVAWVPLPEPASWRGLAGVSLSCATFGEPVEPSVYYFEHHRYDSVQLSVLDQDGDRIHVRTVVSGDLDGLGIPKLVVEVWLDFQGIIVQLPEEARSVQAAAVELARFTSVKGLAGQDRGRNYVFVPVNS
jgi:hypothetical protein